MLEHIFWITIIQTENIRTNDWPFYKKKDILKKMWKTGDDGQKKFFK